MADTLTRGIPEHLRWAHAAYARMMGYFWLPCPLCGRYFGGHEWRDIDGKSSVIPMAGGINGAHYRGICPSCTRAGRGHRP